ncbi:MAG: DUF1573 domain-containing protein [Planctomycetota bacterium]
MRSIRRINDLFVRVRPAIGLVAAAACCVSAAAPASAEPLAQRSSVNEADLPKLATSVEEITLGNIFDDKIVNETFTITNEGGSTLIIRGVKGSCQCTEPVIGDTVLDPGESTEVEVGVKPFNKSGNFRQRITITSNDPNQPQKVLQVNAFVRPLVQMSPKLVNFTNMSKGATLTKTIRVKGRGDDFEISDFSFEDVNVLNTEVGEPTKSVLHGDTYTEYAVKVTVEAKDVGHVRGKLQLHTNLDRLPTAEVPVVVVVKSDLEITPRQLSLNPLRKGQPWKKQIRVTHKKREAFEVSSVRFEGVGSFPIEHEIIEVSPWTYEVVISGVCPTNASVVRGRMILGTNIDGEVETPVSFFGSAR